MTVLKIERRGGLGGFGLAGSRVRSVGEVDLNRLGAADRRAIEKLFADDGSDADAPHPDGFTYRLSRMTPAGEEAVVVAEAKVPAVLIKAIRDEFV